MPTVSDVVRLKEQELFTVPASVTVLEAVQAMNAHRVGAVVVMEDSRMVGIFTERDVMTRVVAAGKNPRELRVRDAMTRDVTCCRMLTDLDEIALLMQSHRIRHVPICEVEGVPVGMISIGDVNAFHVMHKQATIENLSDYICGRG